MSFVTKFCKGCAQVKGIENFSICSTKNNKIYYRTICKDCRKPRVTSTNKKQYLKKSDTIKDKNLKYYHAHKEQNKGKRAIYAKNHANSHKDKNNARAREWQSRKRKDITYKLRLNVGRAIRAALSSGKGAELSLILGYSVDDLKVHLENQFESWMTWENYGKYSANTWKDNDSSTWTWNIDHIIPQSILPYDNTSHPNFSKCWALENLRPLSAKQNILDGVKRVRHVI